MVVNKVFMNWTVNYLQTSCTQIWKLFVDQLSINSFLFDYKVSLFIH